MATEDKVIYGFIAGEISEDFYGRTDIGKYDFGLTLCRNFFVDFCGGIKSRAGFELCGPSQANAASVRTFRFRATVDDYLMEFTPNKMRLIRRGGYIIEPSNFIVDVTDDNLVQVTAHGYNNGDMVYLNLPGENSFRYFEIYARTTNTFRIKQVGGPEGESFSEGLGGGRKVARVYTLATPYSSEQLKKLRIEQSYENFVLTVASAPPRVLTYLSDTNWTLSDQLFGSEIARPTNVMLTRYGTGLAGVAVCVTAVKNGQESIASPYAFVTDAVDYSRENGSLRINWNPVPGAESYNIYRSLLLPAGSEISYAQAVGYIGQSFGPQFIDNNIVPDFTKVPPQHYNPFAVGQVESLRLDAPGINYTSSSQITLTDVSGSGFIGYPQVMPAGVTRGELATGGAFTGILSPPSNSDTGTGGILGVTVLNGGQNYTAPTVSVSGGSGAAFTVVLGPQSGTYPTLCRLFQQRIVYAATENEPMRIWASKPGTLGNMDLSQVVNAGDGYSYQLDSREVRPIQHMTALRYGLLLFTSENITLLRAEEGKALSGVNAVAEPQAYKGANEAEPVTIDLDVLFAQRGSSSVNAMIYTEYTNSFQMQDVAVLSKHLFVDGNEIIRFAFQSEPHKILWCLRNDGVLLSLTYEREQEVFAWAQHATQGRVIDIQVLREGIEEVLYAVIERRLQGRWIVFHERMAARRVARAESYFGVDCGLRRVMKTAARRIDVTKVTETEYSFLFSGSRPSDLAVDDVIFFYDGRFEVTELVSTNAVLVRVVRPPKNVMHIKGTVYYVPAGRWEYCTPIDVLEGLWHLEGETVSVNADGDALLDMVVENGQIQLQNPVAHASVGLQYICEAQTLPVVLAQQNVEGRQKDVVSAQVRLNRTRGLRVGHNAENSFEMKDRQEEDWGEELALRSDFPEVTLAANWDPLNGIYFRQEYPLPAHILSTVVKLDIGDN
jgi:hypothetical protein